MDSIRIPDKILSGTLVAFALIAYQFVNRVGHAAAHNNSTTCDVALRKGRMSFESIISVGLLAWLVVSFLLMGLEIW
jgi:hypothetical protein